MSNNTKIIKVFMVIVVAVSMLAATPTIAFASNTAPIKGNTVTIEGSHIVKNNEELKTGRHTFVLTADKKDNPMPKGSANGVKKVTISSGETFSFGEITFPKPGTYEYTVSRETVSSKTLKQDDSKYIAKVACFSDNTTVLVFEKVGKKEKPNKIEYIDTLIEGSDEPTSSTPSASTTKPSNSTTRTGDDAPIAIILGIFIASAGLLILFAIRRKNKREE